MKVLGIESSCDETAAAIISDDKQILANVVLSQYNEHKLFKGVVPEIAARAHTDYIDQVISQALNEAKLNYADIDAISVTAGPGLIGGVIVGVMTAKAIASVLKKPIIAVNHLEGHALTIRLVDDIKFPYLLLLLSGGHCQILIVEGVGKYKKIGETIDDALGEAFDKVAKMLGFDYPGGPIIEARALLGNDAKFKFPRSMKGRDNCDFSFSGLKTSVKRTIENIDNISEQDINDICASFQITVVEIIEDRILNAINKFKELYNNDMNLVVSGGVAANNFIRNRLQDLAIKHNFKVLFPPAKLCTDNAAMIGWVGVERMKLNLTNSLDFKPRANWSLEDLNI